MPEPLTPALGFRMPAEWEPHAGTWLAWPRNAETWIDRLEAMPAVWAKMAAALAPHETVNILVNDCEARDAALIALRQAGADESNIRFHLIPSNDAWIRDFGPTFVETAAGEQAILDWRYNAWGGKYPPWDDDDRARVRIAEALSLRYYSPGVFMEGGALEVNGRGTLLTCDFCVLNPNRNPDIGRAEMEQKLKQCLGVSKVLWLASGLAGDETDGHIDILARFLDPTTVMVVVEDDPKSENYEPLQENYRRLQTMSDQDGRPLTVIPVSLPRPSRYKHLLLPASYANFYVANGVVLVPTYGDPNDEKALALLARFFPTRKLAPIDSRELLIGGGAIHCVTQQQPAPRKR